MKHPATTFLHYLPALGLAGCLSLDAVPVADPHVDGGVRDGEVAPPDGSKPTEGEPTNGEPSNGEPRAATQCSRGVTTACSFDPASQRGIVSEPVAAGDYIYWAERGTTDKYNNYRNDGAVVRTRVGVWEREDVATGLDFFDEELRAPAPTMLLASSEYVVWGQVGASHGSFLALGKTGSLPEDFEAYEWPGTNCRLSDADLYCSGGSSNLFHRKLGVDDSFKLVIEMQPGIGGSIYFAPDAVYVQSAWGAFRIDQNSGLQEGFAPAAALLGALPDRRVVGALSDGRFGVGVVDGSATPHWKGVAGPGQFLAVSGEWVYWASFDDTRLLMRSSADGQREQQVAEAAQPWQAASVGHLFIVTASDLTTSFEYVPLPSD